jgi:hypothetical protein
MTFRLRGRAPGQLRATDVAALVENRTPESRTLEYKRELPGGTDEAKKEFLADVTAFANTAGGLLLYGVEEDPEERGVPRAIVGVGEANVDAVKQRLTSLLHDGVIPSLAEQVTLHDFVVPPTPTPVIAVAVPRSLVAPHRVVTGRANCFWRRSDAGKYEPDVPELRRMFVNAQSLFEEADAFRRERLRRIAAREIREDVAAASQLFVHVLPLGRLDELRDLPAVADRLNGAAPLLRVSGWSDGYNADGYWTYNRSYLAGGASVLNAYSQWFRFGGVELFTSDLTTPPSPHDADGPRAFNGRLYVHALRNVLPGVLAAMAGPLAVDPPYVVSLSIRGLRGAAMFRYSHAIHPYDGVPRIDRDELTLPGILVEEANADPSEFLRPALDVLWQAFGESRIPTEFLTEPAQR